MAAVSQEEYLKRYLSKPKNSEKKKKLRKLTKGRSRIVDDDVDTRKLIRKTNDGEDDFLADDALSAVDERPQIVGVIDERPTLTQAFEQFKDAEKWKKIGREDEEEKHRRYDSDSDHSLERRQRHDTDSDVSPPRRQHQDSDADKSPLCKRHRNSDSNKSPLHRRFNDSDSDSDSDKSPPRRRRQDSDVDESLPQRRQDSDSDKSPPRRYQDSDSDKSPPRRKHRGSDSDKSPPRRKHRGSDSNKSPPRRRQRDSSSDALLPQKNVSLSNKSPPQRSSRQKTLEGKRAGLQDARSMRRENEEFRKKENEIFSKMNDDLSGRTAKTIVRDRKTGRKVDTEAEERKKKEAAEKQAELDKKYAKWSRGLKQVENQEKNVQDAIHEMSKPLARYADDEDLERDLKNRMRDEDPMMEYVLKKKLKKEGPQKVKPKYQGPMPIPNRFGILPGYRWDGVDRSNGYEKKYISHTNNQKSNVEDSYKWSVADM